MGADDLTFNPKYAYKGPMPDLSKGILMDEYTPIDYTLRKIVKGRQPKPSWADAWEHSTRGRKATDPIDAQATPEERLAVFQQVRDAGDLPYSAGFALVAAQIEHLTDCYLADKIEEEDNCILKSLGEYGHLYQCRNWNDALSVQEKKPKKWRRVFLRLLSKNGEKDIAKIFTDDPKLFKTLREEGRHFFSCDISFDK